MFFAFETYDLGNNTVVHSFEPSSEKGATPSSERPLPHVTFVIQTSRAGFLNTNKETTIGILSSTEATTSPSTSGEAEGPTAAETFVVVDWKKETITFAGVTKTFKEAHKRPPDAGWTRSDLDWTWNGKKYKIKERSEVVTVS